MQRLGAFTSTPPCPLGCLGPGPESWFFWSLKRAVVHEIAPVGLRDVLGHGGQASPLPGPGGVVPPAVCGKEEEYCCFSAQACVLGTRLGSVLGVICCSVVTAGAEESMYTNEHREGHIQKLRVCSKPRAKQMVWLCQEVYQNVK